MSQKAVLLSIHPRYANAIFDGTKTVELRRRIPSLQAGDLVIVYVTSPVCEIQGVFTVESLESGNIERLWRKVGSNSQVDYQDFKDYFDGLESGFGIVIDEVFKLPRPTSLSAMRERNIQPPQGFRYLNQDDLKAFIGNGKRRKLSSHNTAQRRSQQDILVFP
ncbi:ASCH domain-containing protein [Pelagicoccus sp. SDUM812002]|uniref:ASCH domain-containing protein n=1 Tax=Pelagicoccus sp. SDUM812002 TaxID=3041266 RepID=UPI00280FEBD6|nr:ASCH domain-containing protein [Pelagicoccus sp. SDUM812002]MDQ8184293.1 ASCH domain-containing protein [Pelagicoccus sp. SDUM812002]